MVSRRKSGTCRVRDLLRVGVCVTLDTATLGSLSRGLEFRSAVSETFLIAESTLLFSVTHSPG